MTLRVEGIAVTIGGARILESINLTVGERETIVILGPSGSGKTTLLRVIAGLTVPDTGTVTWNGDDLAPVPTHERQVGMVFQDYALFPHLTVGRNVAFGLEVRGMDSAEAVAATLLMVGLEGFADRSIDGLSGGEQQRVALARALITQPRLMLLDEPLGALDATLREHLLAELRELLAPLPTLYVTHDRIEAMAIADRIAIMRGGTIVRVDPPSRIWSDPGDTWTARFIGHENVFEASYIPTSSIREHPGGTHPVTVVDRRFTRGAWATTYRLGDDRTITASITDPVAGTAVHLDFTELPLKE